MARSILAVPVLASLATVLLLPTTAAQLHSPAAEVLRTSGAPVFLELDADTGKLQLLQSPASISTPGLNVGPHRPTESGASSAALPFSFNNSVDDDNWWDVLVHPAGQEIFDWGIKAAGSSNLVEQIVLGYSSRAYGVQQGGPGGAMTFRLYQGGQGFGHVGRKVFEIELTGLFAFGPSLSVAPLFLRIQLGNHAFVLNDGPIAWSFENPDGDTGPILVDVDRALGTQNYYDVYERNAVGHQRFTGTFSLGPGGRSNDPWENTFWLQLYEAPRAIARGTGSGVGAVLSTRTPSIGR